MSQSSKRIVVPLDGVKIASGDRGAVPSIEEGPNGESPPAPVKYHEAPAPGCQAAEGGKQPAQGPIDFVQRVLADNPEFAFAFRTLKNLFVFVFIAVATLAARAIVDILSTSDTPKFVSVLMTLVEFLIFTGDIVWFTRELTDEMLDSLAAMAARGVAKNLAVGMILLLLVVAAMLECGQGSLDPSAWRVAGRTSKAATATVPSCQTPPKVPRGLHQS